MFLDAQLQLSASQAPTPGTTTVTTNAIDVGASTPPRHIGNPEAMAVAFMIESVTGAADAFSFEAIQATAADLTGTVTRLGLRGPFAAAAIPEGTIVAIPLPPGTPTERYLGGRYTLGAGDDLLASAFVVPLNFLSNLQTHATGVVIL